jgi:hypothetical protein
VQIEDAPEHRRAVHGDQHLGHRAAEPRASPGGGHDQVTPTPRSRHHWRGSRRVGTWAAGVHA